MEAAARDVQAKADRLGGTLEQQRVLEGLKLANGRLECLNKRKGYVQAKGRLAMP